eukprot:TRINITY_DN6_c0_g1_i1.p1 TRINITY_DN6_c0_g1~~TRINITY_DN6_c0_g1_i1.p1  ORF type:complete len:813 (-),score=109.33 TRINITY_DN6_c0_g1_i1:81-2519(-)
MSTNKTVHTHTTHTQHTHSIAPRKGWFFFLFVVVKKKRTKTTMKIAFAFIVLAIASVVVFGQQYADLPAGGQRTPNMVTFPAGSLVIDMGDRQIESITTLNITSPRKLSPGETASGGDNYMYGPHPSSKRVGGTAGLFNMYAYGYAVNLLHNNVPLSWVIASNKAKDGNDFSAQAVRIRPSTSSSLATYYNGGQNYGQNSNWDQGGTYGTVGTFSFRGGPLVIHANFANQALTVLNAMMANQTRDWTYSSTAGLGKAKSIVVYNLTSTTTVDVRHLLTHKPYVIVSQLSGDIFDYGAGQQLLENSGMRQGDFADDCHWDGLSSGEVLADFNEDTCVTLFVEPHVIFDSSDSNACTRCAAGGGIPQYRSALTTFVNSGGNFFSECAAVCSYENSLWNVSQYTPVRVNPEAYHNVQAIPDSFRGQYTNMIGAFQSKYGMRCLGGAPNEWGGGCTGSSVCNVLNYPNPDLPLVQFVGDIEGSFYGTITEYYLHGYANETDDNLWVNNGHGLVVNTFTGGNGQEGEQSSGTAPKIFGTRIVPSNRKSYIVSASKLTDYDDGGMVIYSGTHSWFWSFGGSNNDLPSAETESVKQYNGRRMFFNAVLTPVTRPAHCGLSICTDTCAASTKQTLGTCQTCTCQGYSEVVANNQSMCTGSCSVCSTKGSCVRGTCASGSSCVGSGTTYNCIVNSPSPSPTRSVTPSRSVSPSPSPSATPSPSVSATPSPSQTPSPSDSPSPSPSASKSPSRSKSRSRSRSPSPSESPSSSPSPSPSPSASASPSRTPSKSKSRSPSKSKSRSPSVTPSPSPILARRTIRS